MAAARKAASTVKYQGVDRLPSGRYRARYRDAGGKQHSEAFDSAGQARDWRAGQVNAVSRGVHVAPNTRTTVAEYARQHGRPSTTDRPPGGPPRRAFGRWSGPLLAPSG